MNTPTLESAIEASHKALDAIIKGDQSGYLALFSAAEDVTHIPHIPDRNCA